MAWGRQLLAPAATLVGCITSPTWNYGATRAARDTQLASCTDGMLDDCEDNNSQIHTQKGRDGYWFSFKDPWGSAVAPTGRFTMAPSERPGSQYAARISGQIARTGESLYAGVGFAFTDPQTPYDASQAVGVRFWAKGTGRVRFKIADANTAPSGDRCTDCYNDFGVELHLQESWVAYTVAFSQMTQLPGWGDRAPRLSASELFTLVWQVSAPGSEYAVWVDDIELVGCGP